VAKIIATYSPCCGIFHLGDAEDGVMHCALPHEKKVIKLGDVKELAIEHISERLRTQDNRCTSEPMFCLQIKVRDVGYDPAYSEGKTVWLNMESGDYEEVPAESEGAEEFGYKDRWETVMVAFTEQGLKDYMQLDGHNVKRRAHNGETQIFVESFRRCEEMIRIREALWQAKK